LPVAFQGVLSEHNFLLKGFLSSGYDYFFNSTAILTEMSKYYNVEKL
jgi:hypothetical protein